MPGVQGQLEAWKFGGLEAWLLCSAISLSPTGALRSLFSVLCSLFSGAPTAPLPCRGVGQRPTSSKPPIIQSPSCPLLFFNHSGSPACASTPLICSKSAQSYLFRDGILVVFSLRVQRKRVPRGAPPPGDGAGGRCASEPFRKKNERTPQYVSPAFLSNSK